MAVVPMVVVAMVSSGSAMAIISYCEWCKSRKGSESCDEHISCLSACSETQLYLTSF